MGAIHLRDNSFGDVLALYRSGEMKTFSSV